MNQLSVHSREWFKGGTVGERLSALCQSGLSLPLSPGSLIPLSPALPHPVISLGFWNIPCTFPRSLSSSRPPGRPLHTHTHSPTPATNSRVFLATQIDQREACWEGGGLELPFVPTSRSRTWLRTEQVHERMGQLALEATG